RPSAYCAPRRGSPPAPFPVAVSPSSPAGSCCIACNFEALPQTTNPIGGTMQLKRTFIFAPLGGAVLAVAGVSLAMARTPGTSLAEASKATAQYRLLGVARKDQYHLLRDKAGISCIAMPAMPGMGPGGAMGAH